MMRNFLVFLLLCSLIGSARGQSCEATESTLCLFDGRFAVSLDWRDSDSNLLSLRREDAAGSALGMMRDDTTGFFRFESDASNTAVVSVVDGQPINGNFWVFFAAATARELTLTVTDTTTDATAQYFSPLNQPAASVADTQAFADSDARKSPGSSTASRMSTTTVASGRKGDSCRTDAGQACLLDDRFEVRIDWRDFSDNTGTGQATVMDETSAEFDFFMQDRADVLVDIRDGSAVNGEFWYAVAAITNVEFTVTITDLQTGLERTYFNELGVTPTAVIDPGRLGATLNRGHSGYWFNPQAPGQGISVELHPQINRFGFLAYYGFDAAAESKVGASDQRWVTGQGTYEADTLSMTLFSTSGGQFNTDQAPETVAVGTAAFTVSDCRTATLQVDFDEGISETISLERLLPQTGGVVDLCSAIALGASFPHIE